MKFPTRKCPWSIKFSIFTFLGQPSQDAWRSKSIARRSNFRSKKFWSILSIFWQFLAFFSNFGQFRAKLELGRPPPGPRPKPNMPRGQNELPAIPRLPRHVPRGQSPLPRGQLPRGHFRARLCMIWIYHASVFFF